VNRSESLDRLEYWVSEICSEAKRFNPNAIIHITKDTIEDEDIDVHIYVPKEKKGKLQHRLSEMTMHILTEEGYNILALALDIKNIPFYVNAQRPMAHQELKSKAEAHEKEGTNE
jgi:hypothetical protein